jgi:serine/threonine protein kinase
MPHHRIQSIFCQMLLALHYCHHSYKGLRRTLLHRDLKPENGEWSLSFSLAFCSRVFRFQHYH